ncbi:Aminoacylase-1, partial [Operophtera brumata]
FNPSFVPLDECVKYLRDQATALGLPVQVFEPIPKKPVLVMTWEGLEPTLPSILLNSHMDVVPVFEDMKSVAIQYIEAIRRLKAKGIQLKRTVHLSFVPDEEIGGRTGMAEFVKTQDFKNLKVGFALDEGIASPGEEFLLFNGERTIYHVRVTCPGKSGHGSLLLPDNAGEKLSQWCAEAGAGVSVEFTQKDNFVSPTVLDDSNLYWVAFKGAADKLRYLREKGIPALGFSPMSNTEPGLHEHDERLKLDVFLRGIQIYEALVPAIANV